MTGDRIQQEPLPPKLADLLERFLGLPYGQIRRSATPPARSPLNESFDQAVERFGLACVKLERAGAAVRASDISFLEISTEYMDARRHLYTVAGIPMPTERRDDDA